MVAARFSLLSAALLLLLATPAHTAATPRCKCTSSQSCWPSQRAFLNLARQLSNPLITPEPIGSPCFDPSFDDAQCELVHDRFNDGIWRTDQPGAMMSANWEANDGKTVSCWIGNATVNVPRTGICEQGRVPSVGVNATTAADVQAAVKFAAQNNLKVVVKNTGYVRSSSLSLSCSFSDSFDDDRHDFLGRSAGAGSFVIWTHTWKQVNFTENFTPTGGPASNFPAVTVSPGVQWGELYAFVSSVNKTIAGGIGAQGSVGAAGGWPLGGGHNILSPSLGLGVDNILQVTVVTPDGQHLTANAFRNTDLFWALRGGGGPNFGVATSITYRVHDDLPLYAYFFQAAFDPSVFERVMTAWHRVVPNITDEGWSGYYPFANNFLALMYLLRNGTAAQSNTTSLVTFLDEVQTIPTVQIITNQSKLYPGYFAWFDENIGHPDHVIGFNYTAGAVLGNPNNPASWLVPRDLFEGEENLSKLSTAYKDFTIGIGQCVPSFFPLTSHRFINSSPLTDTSAEASSPKFRETASRRTRHGAPASSTSRSPASGTLRPRRTKCRPSVRTSATRWRSCAG